MTQVRVRIGKPVAQIPPAMKPRGGANHWNAIAAKCKETPGQWVPCTFEGLDLVTCRKAVTKIQKGLIAAFRGAKWGAALRGDTLYVRYGEPYEPGEEWELIFE